MTIKVITPSKKVSGRDTDMQCPLLVDVAFGPRR
jgi:hypothetical protein